MKEFAVWGYISFKEFKELRVEQPLIVNGKRGSVLLEVDCDKFWKIIRAKDVPLIKECQRWQ